MAEGEQPPEKWTGAPEKWIGEPVRVRHWIGDKRSRVEGTLQGVGDYGITVVHDEETRFFPWQAVLEIAPRSD